MCRVHDVWWSVAVPAGGPPLHPPLSRPPPQHLRPRGRYRYSITVFASWAALAKITVRVSIFSAELINSWHSIVNCPQPTLLKRGYSSLALH